MCGLLRELRVEEIKLSQTRRTFASPRMSGPAWTDWAHGSLGTRGHRFLTSVRKDRHVRVIRGNLAIVGVRPHRIQVISSATSITRAVRDVALYGAQQLFMRAMLLSSVLRGSTSWLQGNGCSPLSRREDLIRANSRTSRPWLAYTTRMSGNGHLFTRLLSPVHTFACRMSLLRGTPRACSLESIKPCCGVFVLSHSHIVPCSVASFGSANTFPSCFFGLVKVFFAIICH